MSNDLYNSKAYPSEFYTELPSIDLRPTEKVVREQRTTNHRRTQYSPNEERAIVKVGELLILSNDAPGAVPCDVVRDGAVYNTRQNGIVSRQHRHIDSRGYIRWRLYTGKIIYINLLSSFC